MAKRQRRTDRDVVEEIERLTLRGYGPSEIWRRLEADEKLRDRMPQSLRTVQYIAKAAAAPADTSGSWSLLTCPVEDIPAVVDLARHSVEWWGRWPTEQVAEIAVRVATAAPDAPPAFRLTVVDRLSRAMRREEPTRPLELLILFKPWLDDGDAYLAACESDVIPPQGWIRWFDGCFVDKHRLGDLHSQWEEAGARATATAHDATVATTQPKEVTR